MRVRFLGQAGLFLETRGVSIVCDPWFNPAFFASWFPFPANDHIPFDAISSPTFLYLSHLHHDHFDPTFLSEHMSKETTVILPDFPLDKQERELRALGFEHFIKTEANIPFEAAGLRMLVMPLVAPTDGPIGDSALLVDDGDVRLLNMNDSRPIDPDPLLGFGPLDALFLQFSGAIWYPMVYDFPPRMKQALARKKRRAQSARAYRYIEILDPRFVVPSAGPPCFLDDDLFSLNDLEGADDNTFPDQTVFLDYISEHNAETGLGAQGRLMLPWSDGQLLPGSFEVSHPFPPETVFGDKRAYLEGYRDRKRPVIERAKLQWPRRDLDIVAELKAWFEPLLAEADLICGGIDDAVVVDVGDTGVLIDFRSRSVSTWQGEEAGYTFRVDRALVEYCIHHRLDDWVNELFLSCRFSASRRGKYNDYVYTWFKALSEERLQYAEGFYAESGPTTGTWDAAGYRIQARCPHMKADLARFATIEDGVLTCGLHGWQYELATGRCLTSSGHQLWAVPIESVVEEPSGTR